MRLASISLVISIACFALGLAGCGEEELPLFATVDYQMTCNYAGGCTGIPARQISTLNGEAGHNVSCSVQPSGATQLLNFSLDHPSGNADEDYGFRISNAAFTSGGAATGGRITVTEGMNDYTGTAGGAVPADGCRDRDEATPCDQPCRLFDIVVSETANGPAISGKVFCEGLPLGVDPMRRREIHFPGDPSSPATFTVENCDGI